ncbi:MAG: RDD family protein [Campylobacterota bacterium]|nr:RDD family protein [Campylobacterota bacterium]
MKWRDLKRQQKTQKKPQTVKIYYAKFWSRVMGFVTDIFIIGIPVSIFFMIVFGHDEMNRAGAVDVIVQSENALQNAPDPMISVAQLLLSLIIYVTMWRVSMQTPGKKMARTLVVDAKTLERASIFKLTIRFLGYLVSSMTLFLGFFVGLFRDDNRTLHDLISGTAVIYEDQKEHQA